MAELVVGGAFLGIGEHVMGFLDLLELLQGFRVVGIAVRVILHRQAAEAFLDVVVARIAGHAQQLVVVFFRHNAKCRGSRGLGIGW